MNLVYSVLIFVKMEMEVPALQLGLCPDEVKGLSNPQATVLFVTQSFIMSLVVDLILLGKVWIG